MTPQTLDQIQKMPAGPARIAALADYIEAGEAKIRDARRLRNADVRALVAKVGPAEAARRTGLSLSSVKVIKGSA